MMKPRIENQNDYPLLSVRDARILIIVALFGTSEELQKRVKQMEIRHKKRQEDIERRFRNQRCRLE